MSPLLLKRLSDEHLGRRLAEGEAPAFDELYRRYAHRLAAYAGHLLDDAAAGDDVAQTALFKAYQALRAGNAPDAVRPWLYRIAHNSAIDIALRRRDVPSDTLPEVAVERTSASAPLLAAIASLTDHQRRVYVSRELQGMRIDETARELGLSAGQVEQALFAARNRLAEHLVFGERLGCKSVLRLAEGPLDSQERRALKAHLRSCHDCRSSLGARGIALSWLPVPLGSVRDLIGWITAGGAPAAAKVTAIAATTLAVGLPVAAQRHDLPFEGHAALRAPAIRTLARPDAAAPVTQAQPANGLIDLTRWRQAPAVRAAPVVAAVRVIEVADRSGEAQPSGKTDDGGTSDGEGDGDSRGAAMPAVPTTTVATTMTGEHGSDGSQSTDGGGDSSGSGSSGSGVSGGGGGSSPASLVNSSGSSDGPGDARGGGSDDGTSGGD